MRIVNFWLSHLAIAAAIVLSAGTAPSQATQPSVLFAHYLPGWERLGQSVLALDDLNKDGHDDYALGTTGPTGVMIMSGRTGTVMMTVKGWKPGGDGFGWATARIHDVDADGFRDMLVGAPSYDSSTANNVGRVGVVSVKTGKIIAFLEGKNAGDALGTTVAAAGDVNKDGTPDYMVAATGYPNGTNWGRVDVISGKDHKTVLATYTGSGTKDSFGSGLAAAGDLDNDGYDDVVICGVGNTKVFSSRNRIQLKSLSVGLLAEPIGDLNGDKRSDLLIGDVWSNVVYGYALPGFTQLFAAKYGHRALRALPDINGDGVPEIGIGDSYCCKNYYYGYVRILSGKDRKLIWDIGPGTSFSYFGTALDACDVDADGKPDLIVGQTGRSVAGRPEGQAVWVYHLGKLPFRASRHTISLATGGTVNFTIDGGTSRAGLMYMVAGSITGYKPGLDLWGHHIPLNPDPYFYITIGYPNNPFLSNSLGVLDSAGKAVCTLKIPPNLKSKWAGITLDHAAVVFCKSPPMPCFLHLATNARPVTTVQ